MAAGISRAGRGGADERSAGSRWPPCARLLRLLHAAELLARLGISSVGLGLPAPHRAGEAFQASSEPRVCLRPLPETGDKQDELSGAAPRGRQDERPPCFHAPRAAGGTGLGGSVAPGRQGASRAAVSSRRRFLRWAAAGSSGCSRPGGACRACRACAVLVKNEARPRAGRLCK